MNQTESKPNAIQKLCISLMSIKFSFISFHAIFLPSFIDTSIVHNIVWIYEYSNPKKVYISFKSITNGMKCKGWQIMFSLFTSEKTVDKEEEVNNKLLSLLSHTKESSLPRYVPPTYPSMSSFSWHHASKHIKLCASTKWHDMWTVMMQRIARIFQAQVDTHSFSYFTYMILLLHWFISMTVILKNTYIIQKWDQFSYSLWGIIASHVDCRGQLSLYTFSNLGNNMSMWM